MSYLTSVTLQQPFEPTVASTRAALADQGFGVLTEIDVRSTVKSKLGADMDAYLILGACNPTLAHRALQIEPSLGVLLPCNVSVRSIGPSTTIVEAVDPAKLVILTGNDRLASISSEVAERLALVMSSLSAPAAGAATPGLPE